MTMHQLLTLDQLAVQDDGPLNKGEREAVRAIMAERAELLAAIEEARAFILEHVGSGWAVGDMLESLSRKANGGA